MYNLSVAKMLDTRRWHWKGHKVLTTFDNIPKCERARFLPTNVRKEAYREASVAMDKAPFKNTVKFKTLKRSGRMLRMFGAVKIVNTPNGKRLKITDSQKCKQFSKEMIRFDEKNIDNIRVGSSSQIIFDGSRWWLLSPFEFKKPAGDKSKKSPIVALDPGVRTFQTTYSPDGTAKKLGDQAACRIFRLMKYADKLSAFKDRRSHGKRVRLERRVGNLVDEMHWKIARELATDYETIVIPPFETQKMARKWSNGRHRKINKTAVRMMLRLAHYRFRGKLIHVANKLGSRVVICTEEYTSKTCGHCSEVHATLGPAKKFKCPHCRIHLDRDVNGARNICLKAMCC
jgi:transposase